MIIDGVSSGLDASDARLDDLRNLRVPDRLVIQHGYFIAEGAIVVERVLMSELHVRCVLTTPAQLSAIRAALESTDAPVYVVAPATLSEVVGFDVHRGIVAAVDIPQARTFESIINNPEIRTILALECIHDFENLGSMFRSAAALGADAIVLSPQCADPWYRRCVRVSMGNVIGVPFAITPPWPGAVEAMHRAGVTTYAFTPSGKVALRDIRREPDDRIAILVGAEGPGLSASALSTASKQVVIPMHSTADSLNVAVTAALALHTLAPPKLAPHELAPQTARLPYS